MTQWNDAPLDEIRALVDERARYEGWIAALDARRDAAPSHVLDRVRQDYAGRVSRVMEALAAHAGVLREGVQALEARSGELRSSIGEREDALAEVELRALVGEFDGGEAERRRTEVQGALGALRGDADRTDARLGELRALLARTGAAEPSAAPEAVPSAGAATAGANGEHRDGPSAASPAAPAAPVDRAAAVAALDDAFAPATGAGGVPAGDVSTLDAQPAPFQPATPAFGFGNAGIGAAPSAAQAAAPAEPPTAAGLPAEKTLRCPDCGAMNYATEWYCEKCGGELAAL